MNKKWTISFLLFISFVLQISSQEYDETVTHLFWTKDRLLTQYDFQGNGSFYDKSKLLCDSLNMCCVAYVGVYSVIDIPKNKKDRGKLLEKVYFVPMFEKTTSYIIENSSSSEIEKQQIIFDIYELSARSARKKLIELQQQTDSINQGSTYGILSTMFTTIKDNTKNMRDQLINEYTEDVYIQKRKNSFNEWRASIDEKLKESEEYQTTEEDRHRAFSGKPIDKKYIMPKSIIGNLSDN